MWNLERSNYYKCVELAREGIGEYAHKTQDSLGRLSKFDGKKNKSTYLSGFVAHGVFE